jgi:hypothetical protein
VAPSPPSGLLAAKYLNSPPTSASRPTLSRISSSSSSTTPPSLLSRPTLSTTTASLLSPSSLPTANRHPTTQRFPSHTAALPSISKIQSPLPPSDQPNPTLPGVDPLRSLAPPPPTLNNNIETAATLLLKTLPPSPRPPSSLPKCILIPLPTNPSTSLPTGTYPPSSMLQLSNKSMG